MVLQGRNWNFTWNNYTDADLALLDALYDSGGVDYLCYGKEIAPTTLTPHLQGVIRFTKKKRMKGVKAKLNEGCYLDITNNMEKMIEYCKKDEDFKEFGVYQLVQGKRTDLQKVRDMVLEDGITNINTWMTEYIDLYHPYQNMIKNLIELRYARNVPEPKSFPLYKWQVDLNKTLIGDVHERKIIFVVDPCGNSGKTWFTKYFRSLHDMETDVMGPCNIKDSAFLYNRSTRYLFLDIPLSSAEDIDYTFLEHVKDGQITSTKYMPISKRFNPPHVVVFTNSSPDMNRLISDRYCIYNLVASDKVYTEGYVGRDLYNVY